MKRNPKKTKFKENTKLEWRNFLIYFLCYYTNKCRKQVTKDSFKNLKSKNGFMKIVNMFSTTDALIPNHADSLVKNPKNLGTQMNRKDWIDNTTKICDKI